MKQPLKNLNSREYVHSVKQEQLLRQDLDSIQSELRLRPQDPELHKKEKILFGKYMKALKDSISILKQKAKENWLQEGDQNTAFFHNAIRSRQYRNHILSIIKEDGQCIQEQQGIMDEFVNHYTSLFGRKNVMWSIEDTGTAIYQTLSPHSHSLTALSQSIDHSALTLPHGGNPKLPMAATQSSR
ncbi:hypothetical protein RIF29_14379 [Crotalaria pallida]|uniref:Uncharacterized protein n=1 Tax=Crotalaria pallida TaxID=3830 RepID=A0AAN9FGZ1_CROPI